MVETEGTKIWTTNTCHLWQSLENRLPHLNSNNSNRNLGKEGQVEVEDSIGRLDLKQLDMEDLREVRHHHHLRQESMVPILHLRALLVDNGEE